MGDKAEIKKLGKWQCNYCGEIKGVTNGVCPNCGATQTTPMDSIAKQIANVE